MTEKKSLFIKSLLFILGLGVIAFAWYLFTGGVRMTSEQTYLWASVVVMYVIFFCPFFFSSIHVKNLSGKIPSLTMVWLGVIVFIGASIAMTITAVYKVVEVRIAIVIECVFAFLFAIDSYFGYFANSHVQNVSQQEDQALNLIKQIRDSLGMLNLKANSLNENFVEQKKLISFLAEDVKYLSPVDSAGAVKLEQDILGAITATSSACDTLLSGSDGLELKKQLGSLENLIKQRKLMKN